MEVKVSDRVAYFLVAHTKPDFCIPQYFNLIKTADFDVNHQGASFSVSEKISEDSGFRPANSYLADYSIPVIRKLLLGCSQDIDFISIAIHRKFIARTSVGTPAANYPGMYLAPSHAVTDELLRFDKRSNFLIMQPLKLNFGVESQYAAAHIKSDFDQLLSLAIRSKVLSVVGADLFATSRILFPGITLGVTPRAIFLGLAELVDRYVRYTDLVGFRPFKPEDPYQSRARSFFVERLLSYWFKLMTESAVFNEARNLSGQRLFCEEDVGACITVDDVDPAGGIYEIGKG